MSNEATEHLLNDASLRSAVQGKMYDPVLHRVEALLAQGTDPEQVRLWLEGVKEADETNPIATSFAVAWPDSLGNTMQRFEAAVLNHSPAAYLTPELLASALENPAYPEGAQALFFNSALTMDKLRDLLPGVSRVFSEMEPPDSSNPRASIAWREFLHLLALRGVEAGWTRGHPAVVELWERAGNTADFRHVFATSVLQTHGSPRTDLDTFWHWYESAEAAEEMLGKGRAWAHAIVSHPTSTLADWQRLYALWDMDRDRPGIRALWGYLLSQRPDAVNHPWAVSNILRHASFARPEEMTGFMIRAAQAGSWAGVRDYVSDSTVPAIERDLGMLAFLEAAPPEVLAHLSLGDWARCQESKLGPLRQASFLKLGQPLSDSPESVYQPTTPAS